MVLLPLCAHQLEILAFCRSQFFGPKKEADSAPTQHGQATESDSGIINLNTRAMTRGVSRASRLPSRAVARTATPKNRSMTSRRQRHAFHAGAYTSSSACLVACLKIRSPTNRRPTAPGSSAPSSDRDGPSPPARIDRPDRSISDTTSAGHGGRGEPPG
jgi:hypothetical protein